MKKSFTTCFFIILIALTLLLDGCRKPPPPVPVKPEFYSPIEIKPLTFKTTLALPTVENAVIKHLDDPKLPLILNKLNTCLDDNFRDIGRFDIVYRDIIIGLEKEREQNKTPLIDLLKDADVILYLLAITWDDNNSSLGCGGYLVARRNESVIYRFNVDFTYKEAGNEIIFEDKQIYKFTLDIVKRYPRLKGNVISRDGKFLKIAMEGKDKIFVGQQAIVYNSCSPLDPKYKSYDHSFIPVSEVEISSIQEDGLFGEVNRGNENEIKTGDMVILK
ncbi:hypothetical protein KKB18_01290 [bacterium]|nr:hypothetical protein [bacterium]